MESNELLAEIRRHVRVIVNTRSAATRATHGEWLAERVDQLDDRLSHGGRQPDDWNVDTK